MTVEDLMTRTVRTCAPSDSLQAAAQIMWEQDCGSVPVVTEDGRVKGMITDRDVCMSAFLRGQPLTHCAVHEVMAQPVVACRVSDPLEEAQEAMRRHRIRRLPIVDADGCLVGILSLNDLALATPSPSHQQRGLRPEGVMTTLTAISEHGKHDVA